MKPANLFAIGVFLVVVFSLLMPSPAYAVYPDCGLDPPGSYCAPPGTCAIDLGANVSCRSGFGPTVGDTCCAKTCAVTTTCSGWTVPYNTCYNGNETQVCTHRNLDCSTFSWTNFRTVNNCAAPRYTCITGNCIPWYSLTGRVTDSRNGGGVGGISVSAGGRGTSTSGSGNYGFFYAFRAGCYTVSIGLPNDYILTGPGSKGFCVGGDKTVNFTVTRVYRISGRVYDPANNKGIPGIAVHVAGHTTTTDGSGNYLFDYNDRIVSGSYTVTITVPNCWDGLTTSRGVTVGPNRAGINLTMTKQYTIAGKVYDPYNGNAGKGGVTVHVIGKTTTTNGNGDYLFTCAFNIHAGTHAVSITVPADYTNTTPTTRNATVGPNWTNNATGIDFGITELFDVSGNIFVDPNINKLKDGGENNYPSTPSMSFTSRILGVAGFTKPNITTNANGSYTIHNVITGPVTVNYLSLPAGYYMTSPLNGPPPSFRVTSGWACNVNGAPGASCNAGDIINLNYGIVNDTPWYQSTCGDIRDNNGITDRVPNGFYGLITRGGCTTPIAYSGGTDADFGKGQVSSTGEIVGGNSYPESFSFPATTLETSYTSLLGKAQNASLPITNLSSQCTLTNCTLPGGLAHGIYLANSDVTLNNFTFPANSNYVFLINGNLTLNGTINIPVGSTALFATRRNIIVGPNVGTAPATTNTSLDGFFIAGQSFVVNSQNNNPLVQNCNDLRLNIGGAVVVNSLGGGGSFQNLRNMCRFNAVDPVVTFQQRLDMILNAPQFIKQVQTISQEIAP